MKSGLLMLQLSFAYKRAADLELLHYLGGDGQALPPALRRAALRHLDHIHIVDQIFKAHLSGVPHAYGHTTAAADPELAALVQRFTEAGQWYETLVASADDELLMQSLAFTFTDGQAGTMNRLEMLLHVATHAAYHRGAAWALLRTGARTPASSTVAAWLHQTAPSRRDPARASCR